jgi:molybdate transport system ATP-binding protein
MLEASLTKKLWHFTLDVQLKADNQILILLGPSGSGNACLSLLKKLIRF